MSGGSYDNFYSDLNTFADNIERRAVNPERVAFATLIRMVSDVARKLEWDDSNDTCEEAEPAIRALFESLGGGCLIPDGLIRNLKDAVREAETYLLRLEHEAKP